MNAIALPKTAIAALETSGFRCTPTETRKSGRAIAISKRLKPMMGGSPRLLRQLPVFHKSRTTTRLRRTSKQGNLIGFPDFYGAPKMPSFKGGNLLGSRKFYGAPRTIQNLHFHGEKHICSRKFYRLTLARTKNDS